jgi:hypothetical protein
MKPVPRLFAYLWSFPNTLIGLVVAALFLAMGAQARRAGPAMEVHGGRLGQMLRNSSCSFGAITLGHVIIGTCPAELERCRAHEHVHMAQCERWGPFFIPAYLLSSLWQLARGRRMYRDNAFEKEAYEKARIN